MYMKNLVVRSLMPSPTSPHAHGEIFQRQALTGLLGHAADLISAGKTTRPVNSLVRPLLCGYFDPARNAAHTTVAWVPDTPPRHDEPFFVKGLHFCVKHLSCQAATPVAYCQDGGITA